MDNITQEDIDTLRQFISSVQLGVHYGKTPTMDGGNERKSTQYLDDAYKLCVPVHKIATKLQNAVLEATANKPVISDIEMTCGACPTQWEGTTTDGQYVYIRYRHGMFQVGIGATDDDAVVNSQTIAYVERQADGVMDNDEMMQLTANMFDWRRFQ